MMIHKMKKKLIRHRREEKRKNRQKEINKYSVTVQLGDGEMHGHGDVEEGFLC
jgi:hypothetical protein